jgi:hypothetical protein
VLLTRPDEQAILALPMAMPEVLLRLGHREVGWFELGLGAYDPSSGLRPGAYISAFAPR